MADISPDKKLTFQEFPSVSTEEWESVIKNDLKGKNYKLELKWKSIEGVEALPFYRREDLNSLAHKVDPIVHSADWNIIERITLADIKQANEQILQALENGASGLIFDFPASTLSSKSDLQTLLKGVQLDIISLHFSAQLANKETINRLKEYCDEENLNVNSLDISFAFDPFSEALVTGKLASKDSIIQKLKQITSVKSYAVDAAVFGNSGANIIQQIAFALSAGNEYLNHQEELEIEVPELARRIHFNFSIASSYFPEIAKFRAFRLLWSQILDAYGEDLSETIDIHLQAQTADWNKPKQDAYNNMIRTTTEAMSAAIGGCNYITVERFDKNWAEQTPFASRIARNTQHILKDEAYLNKVADAGAGSYYIEILTDDIALKSWELFQEIEKAGGLHEAIKEGMIQELISESRQKKISAYEENEEILVGLNKYLPDEKIEHPPEIRAAAHTSFFNGEMDVEQIIPFNIEAAQLSGGKA